MPYSISWAEDQTLVHQVYIDEISRQDFEAMVCNSRRMLISVPHAADIMIEWQGRRHVMNDLSMLYSAIFSEKRVPPNQRFVFLVNMPAASRVIMQAMQRAAPRSAGSLYFVETVEQVHKLRTYLLDEKVKSV